MKYLGIHLEERLTYSTHVHTKRKELDLRYQQLFWFLSRPSQLSLSNKRLLYMSVLHPIWAYALPIWGCACESLRAIIQWFQSKTLHKMAGTPWYVTNDTLHKDFRIPWVNDCISSLATLHERPLHQHDNILELELLDNSTATHRLRRRHCADLVL